MHQHIFSSLASGMTHKDIAEPLFRSESWVIDKRRTILMKLQEYVKNTDLTNISITINVATHFFRMTMPPSAMSVSA
jgi:DNA-binding NarL/FixJ family response regulator